ncbi:hypothetical protein BCR36DRAFT_266393, partial [Piromyces finnis]
YKCCDSGTTEVNEIDKVGYWSIDKGDWCYIRECLSNTFGYPYEYPCCKSCDVSYVDNDGDWNIENNYWC